MRRTILAAPDDWIDREVLVGLSMAGDPIYQGTLEAIDERGIVLRYDLGQTVEDVQSVFYPLRLVSWVRPASGEEERSHPQPRGEAADILERPFP